MLAQLQRADVGDDRPAILARDAIAVRVHHAIAFGDDIVEVPVGGRAQPVEVERRRMRKAAARDDAVTIAERAVAGRAVDVVALAPALQQCERQRRRDGDLPFGAHPRAGCSRENAARMRDRAFDRLALRRAVGELLARGERLQARALVHIAHGFLAARQGEGGDERGGERLHAGTSTTRSGSSSSRNLRARSASKFGSLAVRQRKKRLRVARSKSGTSNTGCRSRGKPFASSMPTTAASAAKRIVISKPIGMNAGQLWSGRPPTFSGYKWTAEYHCMK